MFGEIIHRILGGFEHALDIPGMSFIVEDLVEHTVHLALRHLIVSRLPGEEEQAGLVHHVFKVIAPVLGPLALEIAWSDGNLVTAGGDDGTEGHIIVV